MRMTSSHSQILNVHVLKNPWGQMHLVFSLFSHLFQWGILYFSPFPFHALFVACTAINSAFSFWSHKPFSYLPWSVNPWIPHYPFPYPLTSILLVLFLVERIESECVYDNIPETQGCKYKKSALWSHLLTTLSAIAILNSSAVSRESGDETLSVLSGDWVTERCWCRVFW